MRILTNGRNDHFNDGTRIGVRQTQTASEFGYALSHPPNTNTDTLWTQLDYLFLYAFPVITNRNHYNPVLSDQGHASVVGSGVTEHVCERLLDNAENRSFQFRPETAEIRRVNFQRHTDAAAFR